MNLVGVFKGPKRLFLLRREPNAELVVHRPALRVSELPRKNRRE